MKTKIKQIGRKFKRNYYSKNEEKIDLKKIQEQINQLLQQKKY